MAPFLLCARASVRNLSAGLTDARRGEQGEKTSLLDCVRASIRNLSAGLTDARRGGQGEKRSLPDCTGPCNDSLFDYLIIVLIFVWKNRGNAP